MPLLAMMGAWGARHLAVTPDMAVRAQLLEDGGPALWGQFMDELRRVHLEGARPDSPLRERLQQARDAARG